jgi:hypothetical protein
MKIGCLKKWNNKLKVMSQEKNGCDLLAAGLARSPLVLGTPSQTSRFLNDLSYEPGN